MDYEVKPKRIRWLIRLLAAAFIFTAGTIHAHSEAEAFSEVCRIFGEAEETGLSREHRSDYILKNVANRVSNPSALAVFEGMFLVEQDNRYMVFKTAAEEQIGASWECKPMESGLASK